MDEMVLQVQRYLNLTYGEISGYNKIQENGKTGWSTMYALTRALQLELGIAKPADNFGAGTSAAYKAWGEMELGKVPTDEKGKSIVRILQGALYCKGYNPTGFTGTFGEGTKAAVKKLQTDAGLPVQDGKVYDYVFKALLTMDAFILTSGGDSRIRDIQRNLNYNYYKTAGVQPCDGHYQRGTQKALIYGIQTEEGIAPGSQTGSVGPSTRELLPNLSVGDSGNFVKLMQFGLYVNGFDPGAFDGSFGPSVKQAVMDFQAFTMLEVDGHVGKQTWLSLLVSTGDSTRRGKACDCVTQITPARAQTLIQEGYETVGRYLTNVPNSTLNKKIQPGELQAIFNAGLKVFPIFQTVGSYLAYFTASQGKRDADDAFAAAREYGFLKGTTIYFAIDFDVLGEQITENIIPYFKAVKERMSNLGNIYQIGIYGPRAACIEVSKKGLAVTSFISGMSTGFSGNLGYPLPRNWAFDQISTITVGTGAGKIEIDNNIKSGKYEGESTVNPAVEYPIEWNIANSVFFDQMDEIYNIALEYTEGEIKRANMLLAQYLRYPAYTGLEWVPVAGPIDDTFRMKVDMDLNNPAIYALYDSTFEVQHEVSHMAATLNSILVRNDENRFFADFAGWAGDLLTVAGDSVKYNSSYAAAMELIGNYDQSITSFSIHDLIADVDAVNIGRAVIDSQLPLNEVMRNYYTEGYKKRFTKFLNNRFSGDLELVRQQGEYVLNSDDLVIQQVRAVFKLTYVFDVPYYTEEQGNQVAQAFADVLARLAREE